MLKAAPTELECPDCDGALEPAAGPDADPRPYRCGGCGYEIGVERVSAGYLPVFQPTGDDDDKNRVREQLPEPVLERRKKIVAQFRPNEPETGRGLRTNDDYGRVDLKRRINNAPRYGRAARRVGSTARTPEGSSGITRPVAEV